MMLAGSENTSITVIDDHYHILYFNKKAGMDYPDLKKGDICYQKKYGESVPCSSCPLTNKDLDNTIYYNKTLGHWEEMASGRAEWPEHGPCTIVFTKELTKGNKNSFYSLAQMSDYDELFEVNLEDNTFDMLTFEEGKYEIPIKSGSIGQISLQVTEHVIHPEDQERFLDFWNFDTIIERLRKNNRVLEGKFRRKLVDGGYRWILQSIVPLPQKENRENILICFIQDIHEKMLEEQDFLSENSSEANGLPGLFRSKAFFEGASRLISQDAESEYCLMVIDIEHFKLFNEWYGVEAGDQFLIKIGEHLKKAQKEHSAIAGYMGGDDFVILLPHDGKLMEELQDKILNLVKEYGASVGFLPAFGVYLINDITVPMSIMYDCAVIALDSIKGNYTKRVAWYDSIMKQRMEQDHVVLSEIQGALEREEFVFYVQPKCNMRTGKIVGLESLVRWIHPAKGNIPPNEFIPVLERNGFITNLDIYLWELVCKRVRRWIDLGHRAIPISVNVSRIDIYSVDVVEVFKRLIEKYELPSRMLEIEITESAYVQDYAMITNVVDGLRENGFTVLMDDFGSGYSSLNMLKDVNVDILKLDIKFLDMNEKSWNKGVGILEAIVKMARYMQLRLVAEGIETKEQAEFLMNIGCIYAQGFYYYKPMAVEDAEKLLGDERNIDFRGIQSRQIEQLSLEHLFNGDLTSESIMNNMLGGVAFYDLYNESLEVVQVNEQYYDVTGVDPMELEKPKSGILDLVVEEYRPELLKIFKRARKDPLNGAEGVIQKHRLDGAIMWMQLRVFFLREQDGHSLFYGAVSDITDQKKECERIYNTEKAGNPSNFVDDAIELMAAKQKFQQVIEYIPENIVLMYYENGKLSYKVIANGLMSSFGYSLEACERALNKDGGFSVIAQEYRNELRDKMFKAFEKKENINQILKLVCPEGQEFWVDYRANFVQEEEHKLVYLCVYSNVDNIKQKEQELWLAGKKLESIIRQANLNIWNWDMRKGTLVLTNMTKDGILFDKKYVERGREFIIERFPESFQDSSMISEESKGKLEQFLDEIRKGNNGSCEILITWKEEDSHWIRIACETICDLKGQPIEAIGYFSDITSEKNEARRSLENIRVLEILRKQSAFSLRVNLTNDKILKGEDSGLWLQYIGGEGNYKYSDAIARTNQYFILAQFYQNMELFTDRNRLLKLFENGIITDSIEYMRMHQEVPRWMKLVSHLARFDDSSDVFAYMFVMDINDQKLTELELLEKAQKDALTGLYNRQTAIPLIQSYLLENFKETAALIMFDFDNFKKINDLFGHVYGDSLISENAKKIRGLFREEDIVCRLGGDEFMVLRKNINEENIQNKLEQIMNEMQVSFQHKNQLIRFSLSVGFAFIPQHGREFEELYQKADIALLQAKSDGKNCYKMYEPNMEAAQPEMFSGEASI